MGRITHIWSDLAAIQGYENAIKNYDLVAKRMSCDWIAKTEKLAREWKPKEQLYVIA